MAARQEVRVSRIPEGQPEFSSTYKILVIGDSNVGKTALLNRFTDGSFHASLMSTVGIDHKNRVLCVHEENVRLQIWDTAGQERFRTLTHAYFRGADGALLLYDVTSRESYHNVQDWMDSVQSYATGIQVVIVGHKCDLEEGRCVSTVEGSKLTENYEAKFLEVSSKTGINCIEVFQVLAEGIKEIKDKGPRQDTHERSKVSSEPIVVQGESESTRKNNVCC